MSSAGLVVVTGMAFEARIAAGTGIDVLYGLRGDALENALAARLRRPCSGVVSFGVAGGLDADMHPGDILVPSRIEHGTTRFDTDPAWSAAIRAALPQAANGLLAGVDAAVASIADKESLHRISGALAADMESHIAARQAHAAAVSVVACRVVIDPATRAVPQAALAAMGESGRTDFGALLRALAEQPRQLADLLLLACDARLARAALRAARAALGEHFARPEPIARAVPL